MSRSYTPQPYRVIAGQHPPISIVSHSSQTRAVAVVAPPSRPPLLSYHPQQTGALVVQAREVDFLREQVAELRGQDLELREYRDKHRASQDEIRSLHLRIEELTNIVGSAAKEVAEKEEKFATLREEFARLQTQKVVPYLYPSSEPIVREVPTTKQTIVHTREVVSLGEAPAPVKSNQNYPVSPLHTDPHLQSRVSELEALQSNSNIDRLLKAKEEHIQTLTVKNQQLESEVQSLREQSKTHIQSIQALKQKAVASEEELESQLSVLRTELNLKNEKISHLQVAAYQRDVREAALEARVASFQTEATRGFSSTQPGTTAELRAKLAQLENDLELRDKQIEVLQQQLKAELANRSLNSSDVQERARSLETQLNHRMEEINGLRSAAIQNQASFSKVVEENRSLGSTIQLLQAELRSVNTQGILRSRDETIRILEQKIALQAEEFIARETALKSSQTAKALIEKEEQLSILQKKYTLAQQEIEVLTRAKVAENQTLNEKFTQLQETLKERNSFITELEADKQELLLKMKDYEAKLKEIKHLENLLETKDKENQALVSKLQEYYGVAISSTKVVVETIEGSISEQAFADVLAQLKHLEREVTQRESENITLKNRLASIPIRQNLPRIEERIVPVDSPILVSALRTASQELMTLQRLKDAELAESRRRIQTLLGQVESLTEKTNALNTELAQYKTQISPDLAENDSLRRSIKYYDGELKRARQVSSAPRLYTTTSAVQLPSQAVSSAPRALGVSTSYVSAPQQLYWPSNQQVVTRSITNPVILTGPVRATQSLTYIPTATASK
eukprot:TRINITY_DN11661_c0_g3_i1.p1 TRINITY_DN11661_c0_g3~~TRINITY_DN11661_c0_g3_i1.p1  ORF type:complete len:799 (+),score=182.10 TRINITY_DN11661_c0_g3_i1:53-2449(+)